MYFLKGSSYNEKGEIYALHVPIQFSTKSRENHLNYGVKNDNFSHFIIKMFQEKEQKNLILLHLLL